MAKKMIMTYEDMWHDVLDVEEKPYALPDDWVWVKLGYTCNEIKNGTTIKQNKEINSYPVTRIESLQNNTLDLSRLGYICDEEKIKDKDYYEKDDVALSHINSEKHVGKTALIVAEFLPLVHGMNLLRLRFNKNVYSKYFHYYSQTIAYKIDVVKRINRAVNQVSLNQRNLKQIPFPLPSLEEQKRIVGKIERMFEELNRAKELIEEVLEEYDKRRSSILHIAFTGELTAKWRKGNGVMFDASIIEDLRFNRLEKCITQIQKNNINDIYDNAEVSDSSILPRSWKFISLDKLCSSFQYGTSSKSQKVGDVAVLRMGNLQQSKIDWSNLVFTSDEKEIEKYRLKKGDVLFNRTNSAELVGKTSIYEGEQEAIFAGYLIKINNYSLLNSNYLNYALNTDFAKAYCNKVKSDSVNQSNINAKKLSKFEIPFCSFEEQSKIVRLLDHLLEKENNSKELVDILKNIELMKKSILARAFRGELDTHDDRDGTGMELLKKILIERSASIEN